MENKGIKCNVCECVHNCGCDKCDLEKVVITHERTDCNGVEIPHFCKSYTCDPCKCDEKK